MTAKDAVTGGIFTVYLKNISENKNGIVGTEVDKSGHEIKDKEGFDGRKHIILKGAILKQQEVRLNQKYGEMEVHCQAIGEKIVPSKGEIKERYFNIVAKPKYVNKTDFSNLFIRIDNLTLSVRTLNCLINGMGLTYIGELAQKNDFELMKSRNFGRKCLREVKKILSANGLQLGLIVPDFDTLRYEYEHTQNTDDVEDNPKIDNIDRKSCLDLFRKVSELDLSPRALNCMDNAKIMYVGDLVTKKEYELLKIRNMGRLSISEIKSNLNLMGLDLGMQIHEWSQINVEEEIKLLSDELEIHRKNKAKLFLPDIKHADFLEEELINFVEMFSKGKNIPIIASFFGFDGKGKKTLEVTGEEFDITRERVRQITKKVFEKNQQKKD